MSQKTKPMNNSRRDNFLKHCEIATRWYIAPDMLMVQIWSWAMISQGFRISPGKAQDY
jgi:hypothetical protein